MIKIHGQKAERLIKQTLEKKYSYISLYMRSKIQFFNIVEQMYEGWKGKSVFDDIRSKVFQLWVLR